MVRFNKNDFRKTEFSKLEIDQYKQNAERDLEIAGHADIPQVKFDFSFKALIKLGIIIIAIQGFRAASKRGHHIKIIEKISEILHDDTIEAVGNAMRTKRNQDFYGGGILISEKEADEYFDFVKDCFSKAGLSCDF